MCITLKPPAKIRRRSAQAAVAGPSAGTVTAKGSSAFAVVAAIDARAARAAGGLLVRTATLLLILRVIVAGSVGGVGGQASVLVRDVAASFTLNFNG